MFTKLIISEVNNARKLPSGSILAYDENHIEYFAVNTLVSQMDQNFVELLLGKKMFILFFKEIWTGSKWQNRKVNKIEFIASELEIIHKYLNLTRERENIAINLNNCFQEYLSYLKNTKDFTTEIDNQKNKFDIELNKLRETLIEIDDSLNKMY